MKIYWNLKPRMQCPKCEQLLQLKQYQPQSQNPFKNNGQFYYCADCQAYFKTPNHVAVKQLLLVLLIFVPLMVAANYGLEKFVAALTSEAFTQWLGIPHTVNNLLILLAIGLLLSFPVLYLFFVLITSGMFHLMNKGRVEIPADEIEQLTPLPPRPKDDLIKDIKAMTWKQRLILFAFTASVIAALVWLYQNLEDIHQ